MSNNLLLFIIAAPLYLIGTGLNIWLFGRALVEAAACAYSIYSEIAKAQHRNILLLPAIQRKEVPLADPETDEYAARIVNRTWVMIICLGTQFAVTVTLILAMLV